VPPPATAEAELPKATKLKEVQPLSEEEKLHSEARRFARLLVSEVKLYNEQQVAEGRANRDLYYRLRRDIDRSRELYEMRVSALVARKVDYFHDEVIRILAGNDPAALGKDYPGPRVAE
jgi:FAD/FMN-containing dehydrogenase